MIKLNIYQGYPKLCLYNNDIQEAKILSFY